MTQPTFSNKLSEILFHILFWSLYVASEYIADLPHLQGTEHWRLIWSTMLSLPVLMIPTYFVVLFVVPNYLRKGRLIWFVIFVLGVMAFIFYGRLKWFELVNYINYDYVGSMPATKVLKNVIRDYSIVALGICIYIIGDWRKKERENRKLIEAKAKSDLELLKRQLHPHFLFNTLNNIYSLSLKNSDRTDQSILKLSSLLEYLVYQSGEIEVALSDELELINNYIDLEILRYGSELNVQIDFKEVDENLKTPPLILLPFVENCFKHGGKNEKGIFWIKLKIRVFENKLSFFAENSKGRNMGNSVKNRKGIGLQNIQERLDLLYKDRYSLQIEDSRDFFSMKLELLLSNERI